MDSDTWMRCASPVLHMRDEVLTVSPDRFPPSRVEWEQVNERKRKQKRKGR